MNILAFFAHPDDETILAGGTLALLAQAGAQVHYLCATRGEGGETGEPPVCTIDQLGDVREKELVCAVGALGGRSLTFLDYRDPRVDPGEELCAYTDDIPMLAGQAAATMRQFGIEAVITHGSNGEYGHPAHQITHQAALVAGLSFGEAAPLLYSVAASFPDHPRPILSNADDAAHLVLDISSTLPHKEKAALCHRTQHALFMRRASEEAERPMSVPEVLMRVESLRRIYPWVKGELKDELAQLLITSSIGTST
jgi:LmbE family N-acetylglucosaminyl deacetylase